MELSRSFLWINSVFVFILLIGEELVTNILSVLAPRCLRIRRHQAVTTAVGKNNSNNIVETWAPGTIAAWPDRDYCEDATQCLRSL